MKRSKKVMENYVCPECWNQIQNCTCEFYPPWHLVMVDVGVQEIVRTLNKKGYNTTGCCESHFDGNPNLYVAFAQNYDIGLPEGFSYIKGKMTINYYFKKNELATKEKYEKIKAEKLDTMLTWAKSLPENPRRFRR